MYANFNQLLLEIIALKQNNFSNEKSIPVDAILRVVPDIQNGEQVYTVTLDSTWHERIKNSLVTNREILLHIANYK